ncbi:hypothetical protein HA402_004129 [Bradysia odoriphaga]|nr:hypothetical protein HA402_004129 [Bradysia odoriphaga]
MIAAAVAAQAAQFTHTCFMISPYESYIDVAEALNRVTPGDFAKKSALFNSGAEAVENAIKIARKHTGRQAVVAFDHGYHGRTNLTMALTAKSMPYKSGFGPFAPEVYRATASYPFRDGLDGAEAAARAILQLEKQIGADNLAAVIIEPIQGEGGFIVPADGFLPAIVDWCRANGVVFIADERDLRHRARPDHHGQGHRRRSSRSPRSPAAPRSWTPRTPVVSAAPTAATRSPAPRPSPRSTCSRTDGVVERAREIGDLLKSRLAGIQQGDARIGDIRGHGAMIAAEFVDPDTKAPDAALTAAVAKACIAQGVIVLTCGTYGNVIRFLPPLVHRRRPAERGPRRGRGRPRRQLISASGPTTSGRDSGRGIPSHDRHIIRRRSCIMAEITRDVLIIGAGAAGTTAANDLRKAGLSVAVLEARDRVGGRLWTDVIDGAMLEIGGQWVSPDQDALKDAIEELGLETYSRYREGDSVYVGPRRSAPPLHR